jgi:hypothetical protein
MPPGTMGPITGRVEQDPGAQPSKNFCSRTSFKKIFCRGEQFGSAIPAGRIYEQPDMAG